jgi:predicted nucleic acid-binding Zn ribbon protein
MNVSSKYEEIMKKNLFEVYSLAVCFISVLILIVATGIGIYDLIEISFPKFTISSYIYKTYSSNENYLKENTKYKNLSEEEVTKRREEKWKEVLENEQRNACQSLIQILIFILISVVAFIIHWIFAKKIQLKNSINSNE